MTEEPQAQSPEQPRNREEMYPTAGACVGSRSSPGGPLRRYPIGSAGSAVAGNTVLVDGSHVAALSGQVAPGPRTDYLAVALQR